MKKRSSFKNVTTKFACLEIQVNIVSTKSLSESGQTSPESLRPVEIHQPHMAKTELFIQGRYLKCYSMNFLMHAHSCRRATKGICYMIDPARLT